MNFTSQICTTKEQSERLLALGLNKDTADMTYLNDKICTASYNEMECPYDNLVNPAWSLHRLIEIIPNRIKHENDYYHFDIFSDITGYAVDYIDPDDNYYDLLGNRHNNLFEGIISLIEWLIKEGCFDKKYLK